MLLYKAISLTMVFVGFLQAQEILDIMVKGISDAQNDGAQKDRMEAIMDAKLQACEKAGVAINAKTTVENFQTVYDLVESKSEAVLLPGYQLMDVGYTADGTFQVVLSGKIKIIEEEQISIKELRYAQSLNDRGKFSECKAILEKYIDSKDADVSEDLKQESLYYYIKWGYSFNLDENVEKFAAYYPDSEHNSKLQKFAAFAKNPLCRWDQSYQPDTKQWLDQIVTHEDKTYGQQIVVVNDTITIKDFDEKARRFFVRYLLLRQDDDDNQEQTAYLFQLLALDTPEPKVIEERLRTFAPGGSPTFQHSASGFWYDKFSIKNFQISGNVPVGSESYTQKITFDIYQKAF
jgi:hypothetical protein